VRTGACIRPPSSASLNLPSLLFLLLSFAHSLFLFHFLVHLSTTVSYFVQSSGSSDDDHHSSPSTSCHSSVSRLPTPPPSRGAPSVTENTSKSSTSTSTSRTSTNTICEARKTTDRVPSGRRLVLLFVRFFQILLPLCVADVSLTGRYE
jgi:hypothetical protein